MIGMLFALGAATIWGLANVCIRLAVRDMRVTTCTVYSLFAGLALLVPVAFWLHWDALTTMTAAAVGTVFVYGMANFLLGRFLNYASISRIGLNRSVPIVSASPLPALVMAVLLLDEQLSPLLLLGTAAVMGGVLLIVTERR